ncbi:PP2C family serine/threonine-protein phosphatase [Aureispira anguillae]|uniref:Protein phosphatase 2C domain-containing protein n=1 Tax=Aureispira anguillae TaxID=2864201 RepID=A0A916DPA0_9BACT|nr:PP2C family serine/threonine-protein phosphatase [Aureispira anguillae]BDS10026.1 protein phosphatase 2C domain-containing protein [Aureispira anguillae]
MSSDKNNSNWIVAYASVIGNGHILMNLPCQDSCAHQRINDTWGVAVVADGAGSAAHSDIGSDFVARNMAHCLEEIVKREEWKTADRLPTEEVWRTEALKALQIVRQRLEQFATAKEHKIPDLACTVLAILYAPFGILTTHIGDGRAAYSVEEGKWEALIEPFRGSEVNETVFITSNIWTTEGVDLYIQSGIVKGDIRAFALLSDGCENGSFEVNVWDEENEKYHDPNRPYNKFFEPNLRGMLQLKKENKPQEEINQIWGSFLTEGSKQFKHETDDKTMILGVAVPKEL